MLKGPWCSLARRGGSAARSENQCSTGEWRAARRVIEAIAGPSLKQARVPSAQLRQPCELTRGRGVVVPVQLVRLRLRSRCGHVTVT